MTASIAFCGAMARRARCGGHAWVFLQYLLGLRRLGFEVTFMDRVGQDEGRAEANYVASIMDAFGVEKYSILDDTAGVLAGLTRPELLKQVHGALLVNVMGYLDDEAVLEMAGRRAFSTSTPATARCGINSAMSTSTQGMTITRPSRKISTILLASFPCAGSTGSRPLSRWCSTSGLPQPGASVSLPWRPGEALTERSTTRGRRMARGFTSSESSSSSHGSSTPTSSLRSTSIPTRPGSSPARGERLAAGRSEDGGRRPLEISLVHPGLKG